MPKVALLDFLYADHERVASLLAQLTGVGSLKESERSAAKGKSSKKRAALDLKLTLFGAEGGRDWNQEVREAYDPLWTNSRRLIDEVKQREEGRKNCAPKVGQLRIFSGTLLCYDHSLITGLL